MRLTRPSLSLKYVFVYTLTYFGFVSIAEAKEFPAPIIVGNQSENIFQIIYPLGWSKDGKFAYIHLDTNLLSETEIYHYDIVVQDMRSNKVLWKNSIVYDLESLTLESIISESPSFSLQKISVERIRSDPSIESSTLFNQVFWALHANTIKTTLNKFEITAEASGFNKIAAPPKLNVTIVGQVLAKSEDCIEHYQVKLIDNNHGEKIVHDYFEPLKQEEPCLDPEGNEVWYRYIEMMGYFNSPYENRIAIVVFQVTDGYEEPWEFPALVGADLDTGFR